MDMERGGKIFYLGSRIKDFPGGPVVKTVSSTAGGIGSIPGQGSKILQDAPCGQKKIKTKPRTIIKKKKWGAWAFCCWP